MNAQQIIDESVRWTREDIMATFYPKLYAQEEAELNLIKCVRRQK